MKVKPERKSIVMQTWAKIVSRINGRTIGEIRHLKASPFIVGSMCHFLPTECHTSKERNSLRFCTNKMRWNGLRWEFVERLELTQKEWREAVAT